jgi:hypothetical protein
MAFWIPISCSLLSIFLIQNVFALQRIDPLVNTDLGLIQGLKASDGDYSMFMGIPYAQIDPSNPFGVSGLAYSIS